MRVIDLPESSEVKHLIPNARMLDNRALGDAIGCLRDELISLYVTAEEIHWHLRVGRHKRQSRLALPDETEVARQLTGNILGAIVGCVCIKEKVAGQGDGDALLRAVLALRAENDAVITSVDA